MRYDNDYVLKNRIDIYEACVKVFLGVDIWGLPKCNCPSPPDLFRIYASEYADKSLEEIKETLTNRFTVWAIIV